MATTIYDIAREVGTSAVTVSLALRNSSKVSKNTQTKIKEVAQKLDYRPNPLGRGLVGAPTKTIAFVFNYASEKLANDMTFIELFNYIAHEASTRGYKIFFHSSIVAKPIKDVISEVASYAVDGIVLISKVNPSTDEESLEKSGVPIVLINRDFHYRTTSCLLFDDISGGSQIMQHLFSLGHRRIAFVGKHENESAIRRFESYKESLRNAGIAYDDDMVLECGFDVDSGEQAATRIAAMSSRPTAVMAASDLVAIGVMAGLRQHGILVPEHISITGFSNMHISKFTYPTLTTIDFSGEQVAAAAIEKLLKMISGECQGVRKVIPAKLIIRNSTMQAAY